MAAPLTRSYVEANGLTFGLLEAGPADGPLALCLHGFPDTAHTWRHLLPELGTAGYHAVAPFLRGYAPTDLAPDGNYQAGALVRDVLELHGALGGGGDAVLLGHDWGAIAAYGALGAEPDRWRRAVTAAVPPAGAFAGRFLTYDQLRRSWYVFFFQSPLAEAALGRDEESLVGRLWADWSPGYDATADLELLAAALPTPERRHAAIAYYRALYDPSAWDPALDVEQRATSSPVTTPVLYLHGDRDGCFGLDIVDDPRPFLGPGSEMVVVRGGGHFAHLEQPAEVGEHVLGFLGPARG